MSTPTSKESSAVIREVRETMINASLEILRNALDFEFCSNTYFGENKQWLEERMASLHAGSFPGKFTKEELGTLKSALGYIAFHCKTIIEEIDNTCNLD